MSTVTMLKCHHVQEAGSACAVSVHVYVYKSAMSNIKQAHIALYCIGHNLSPNNNNNNIIIIRFPAHDELGTCRASLVSPEQSVLSIPTGSIDVTVLTVTQRNIIETGPRATWWAATLDLTKQKLLRQSIIRHPENMT